MASTINKNIRFEPDERPPHQISISTSVQASILGLSMMSMVPIAVIHAAGQEESYLEWMVFTTIIISGIGMLLQAGRFGRIGSGQLALVTSSATFIPLSIEALLEVGPGAYATLILLSAPVSFLVSRYLPKLRRIVTPVVAGTVLMLIGASFMPTAFTLLEQVPEDKFTAGIASAGATLLTVIFLTLRSRGFLRLWTLVIGLSAGCVVSMFLGLFDFELVTGAGWVGWPSVSAWPGFDLSPSAQFWVLLAVFLLVTFANSIKTIGSAIVVEQVSWRTGRPVGYRTVQGALNADGFTGVLCGVAGTPPCSLIPDTAAFISFTGVAARRIGILTGLVIIGAAFIPKAIAPLLAIPNPVVGALLFILGLMIFIQGFKIIFQDGIDHKKAIIAGVSLWIGISVQSTFSLPEHFPRVLHLLLGNGVMVGGMVALLLTAFVWLTSPHRKKLHAPLDISSTPRIDQFLIKFASSIRWGETDTDRLRAAGEEALAAFVSLYERSESSDSRMLLINALFDEDVVDLEFISGPSTENLEVQLESLAERPGTEQERDISLRLLRHYASSVRHHSYYNIDILTIRVERT